MSDNKLLIGIAGSGAMGTGIAQVALAAGHHVVLFDSLSAAMQRSEKNLNETLTKLEEKGKLSSEKKEAMLRALRYTDSISELRNCGLVIEAIVEDLAIKRTLFTEIEKTVSSNCLIASNTSSLSITGIARALSDPGRFVGIHFFNPAPLMPLVEIIPGIATRPDVTSKARGIIDGWGKVTVLTKDTPGFIVNRVARPFYSEALRIYDEGLASMSTIDWAMKQFGQFRMGPFELMDMIGHDVNYVVTETVWTQLYYDPRFKPSLTQKRLFEAGFLGKKSGRGFYDYSPGAQTPEPIKDDELGDMIYKRILAMLINEAADTVYLGIANATDVDLAMTKGVNYPKGLLAWADEMGTHNVLAEMNRLYEWYQEDRYRPSPLLKKIGSGKKTFFK